MGTTPNPSSSYDEETKGMADTDDERGYAVKVPLPIVKIRKFQV